MSASHAFVEAEGALTRRECGICWSVYDPSEGDAVAQIPPGTPFEALPDSWCCPHCEAPKHKFMVLAESAES